MIFAFFQRDDVVIQHLNLRLEKKNAWLVNVIVWEVLYGLNKVIV